MFYVCLPNQIKLLLFYIFFFELRDVLETLYNEVFMFLIKIIKNFLIRNNTLDKVIKFQRVIGKKNLIERFDKVGSTTENINVRHLRSTVV